jgi:NADH-quinone oxidoreductase subunit A
VLACQHLCTALSVQDASETNPHILRCRSLVSGALSQRSFGPWQVFEPANSEANIETLRTILSAEGVIAMSALLQDYLPLVVFIGIALVIGLALLIAPFIVAYKQPDPEKLSAYECGFNAFDDARMKFDARYYLVAILFIIFDLEVAFLFPWAVALQHLGWLGFWSMMVFLAVLTIGFIYEWRKGALEWD